MQDKRLVDDDAVLTPAEAKAVRRGEAQLKRRDSKTWGAVLLNLGLVAARKDFSPDLASCAHDASSIPLAAARAVAKLTSES